MAKLLWDQTGEHFFETGIDHGILFPMVNNAYPAVFLYPFRACGQARYMALLASSAGLRLLVISGESLP